MGQMVEIPKEKGFKFSALFYDINTDENGLIEFEVNPNLKPYLLNITNNFTSYDRHKISHLKSFYSIRLYELLKQYQDKTGGGWWKVTLEKLKEILKISEKQYKLYGHLKDKVILVAQRELKEKTDIKFSFEEQKKGRKIDVITFYILPNTKATTTQVEPIKIVPKKLPKYTKNESHKLLSETLKIDESFIAEIYKTYDEKQILQNAKYTHLALEKENIKTSIGGFLRKALKNDYASQISLTSIKQEQKEAKEKEEHKKANIKQKEQEKMNLLKQDFNHSITQKMEEYILANEKGLEAHFEDFKEKFSFAIGDEADIKKAIDEKPMIRNFFINFLSKKVLDKKELDFEYYKNNLPTK
jgi:plasmid replication initiation protein